MSEEEIIEEFKELIYNPDYDEILLCTEDGFTGWHELFKNVLDLYQKEKEKNNELQKQNKILEVEKVRYNIQYLESDISQIPDTAMVYHSMRRDIETLKEQKTKLEKELQELLEERN